MKEGKFRYIREENGVRFFSLLIVVEESTPARCATVSILVALT